MTDSTLAQTQLERIRAARAAELELERKLEAERLAKMGKLREKTNKLMVEARDKLKVPIVHIAAEGIQMDRRLVYERMASYDRNNGGAE